MILGIDPGPKESGFAVLYDNGRISGGVSPNETMHFTIAQFVGYPSAGLERVIAIEQIRNMGMVVGQEVFDTVFWTGRFYESCAGGFGRTPMLLPRNDIKLHLCGSPRAKDKNIRQALIDRWGAPGTKKNPGPTYGITSHAWAALAVATVARDLRKEKAA